MSADTEIGDTELKGVQIGDDLNNFFRIERSPNWRRITGKLVFFFGKLIWRQRSKNGF